MNILITGAKGFVGRNLVENLKNMRDGKNRTRPNIKIDNIYEYDIESTRQQLDAYCADADFVFNLAGVNRPKDPKEYREGNFGFASTLLETLKKHKNLCPVMLSSSIQATLQGRFGTSEYGLSKKAGEDLFFEYAKETGAKVEKPPPTGKATMTKEQIDALKDTAERQKAIAENHELFGF